jgi:hypothetical protein
VPVPFFLLHVIHHFIIYTIVYPELISDSESSDEGIPAGFVSVSRTGLLLGTLKADSLYILLDNKSIKMTRGPDGSSDSDS